MTISKKQTRKNGGVAPSIAETPIVETPLEQPAAQALIQAAEHAGTSDAPAPEVPPVKAKKKSKDKDKAKSDKKKDKKNKEAVIIRFEDGHLRQIDATAEALGLSRAAWVRMVVAKALIQG